MTRWTVEVKANLYSLAGGYAGMSTISLDTIADIRIDRGGGDDYTAAQVAWCTIQHKNPNPRWSAGTIVQVSMIDTGSSSYDWPVFIGQLVESRWNDRDGVSDLQFRGTEFRLFRRADGLTANASAGPRGTVTSLLTAASWTDWDTTVGTDRILPSALTTLDRPAQGTTLNGQWIQTALAGTTQNLVYRAYDGGMAGRLWTVAPDRIISGDVVRNGNPTGYLCGTNMDAQKVKVQDAGVATAQFSRKWRAYNDTTGATSTQTAGAIPSTVLETLQRDVAGWYKTNTDAATISSSLMYRQGSDLQSHRIFLCEYWPDKYNDLGGTNSTTLYKLQPGDWITFTNLPSIGATNVNVWGAAYANPVDGTGATTYYTWDVRRAVYLWNPDGGWKFELGMQPRTKDGWESAGAW